MKRKYGLKLFLVLGAILTFYILYAGYQILSFSSQNELVHRDAAVVLGAAVLESGEPSPVFRERIRHAIWLYKEGYADKLIFTGGKGEGATVAESDAAKAMAMQQQVPEQDILIETKSAITEENLRYAQAAAATEGLNTFIIVSDPLHMKRSMAIAEHLGMDAVSSPTPTTMYQSFRTRAPFFLRELFFYIGYQLTLPFR
ncbi:YdcF family protein [Paenibacillus pinihumi]|uniref:YdcF family protein n=1 Tax=Paenibacillus pinihumi TaxID=669462 RepID=UPI000411ED97|nr:YdcF family protein [Paenibacillus pinihumi]